MTSVFEQEVQCEYIINVPPVGAYELELVTEIPNTFGKFLIWIQDLSTTVGIPMTDREDNLLAIRRVTRDGEYCLIFEGPEPGKLVWKKLMTVVDFEIAKAKLETQIQILQEYIDRPNVLGSKIGYQELVNALK